MQPAQKIKGTEAEREQEQREQEQRAGGFKFELAILQQRTTLSKLCNGTLDVA